MDLLNFITKKDYSHKSLAQGSLQLKASVLTVILRSQMWYQWSLNGPSVTDPGFPRGGGANPPGAPTYDFAKFSQKTAWNWNNLDPGGTPKIRHWPQLMHHCFCRMHWIQWNHWVYQLKQKNSFMPQRHSNFHWPESMDYVSTTKLFFGNVCN